MGSLWVARHVELDVQVAVKFNAMEREDAHDLRFRREARATARLKSPHIVHVFDYGIERGEPYIAMELLEGESLRELLQREGRLPLARVAALVADVGKGLEVAHRAGIVHRDLKPSNLFLARAGSEEVVKILDFGIAKANAETAVEARAGASNAGDEATRVGTIVGSPAYMSPEQARGEAVDERSDLWSLAVVTFRVLTGVEPFSGADTNETLEAICNASLPRVREITPDLPAELDRFFERALARPRERRFQSALELSGELEALAARHPQPALSAQPLAGRAIADAPGEAVGRTGATRPLDLEAKATRIPKKSLFTAVGALGVTALSALGLYFWMNRSAPEPSGSELASKSANETNLSVPSATNRNVVIPEPPSTSSPTALNLGAGKASPRPAARKQTAQRALPSETPPAGSSRGSRAHDEPPAPEDVDPTFGLKR
jgi:serine/threonine-protein kinase